MSSRICCVDYSYITSTVFMRYTYHYNRGLKNRLKPVF